MATTARLQVAADHGTAGTAAADLAAAFEYLQQLRLRHQAGRLAAGAGPDDAVVPCTAARAFVGNEVEQLMDWSMEDELALYLCHGVGTSSAVMLGAAVVDQQG